MIRIFAIRIKPDLYSFSATYADRPMFGVFRAAQSRTVIPRNWEHDRNLSASQLLSRSFEILNGVAPDIKTTSQQCNPFAHARKPKRVSPGKGFFDLESDSVIFN